jgi:tetratricopeptide (TPR) repeat protein
MKYSISILSLITMLFCCTGCNNKNSDKQAFDDILSQAPYAALTDSIKREPANDELYFKRAILLNSNDLPEPALIDFRKAWSLNKQEKYAFGLGNLLLEKKPDSAILFLKQATAELPNSFLLSLTLGRALIARNRFDEALVIADQLITKNPNQVDVLKMKADILAAVGKKKEAISALHAAYALTPQDVELNYMLALRLAEAGDPRLLRLCDSLAKADSLGIHAEPYYYKGIYYSTLNDKQQAVHYFDQAIKRDYYFLDGYIEKGAVLYDQKKYKEALGVFNLCLTISPKFADAYYWIGKTQEAQEKKQEALLNYQRAFSLDPNLLEAKAAADKLK